VATFAVWQFYRMNLRPVSAVAPAQTVVVESGSSPRDIADLLKKSGLIRSAWAFETYVRHEEVGSYLQAGTYSLSASQSVQTIVAQLTHGKVKTELVTILPGQTIEQIEQSLINDGFAKADVEQALEPTQYENSPALVDKPKGNSLEGYLYPDSFQRTSATKPAEIIQQSLLEMQQKLTPEIRAAFAREGLSTYQGITLASIVQHEVAPGDYAKGAQVFLKRISIGMPLGSDVTAIYGAEHDGIKLPSGQAAAAAIAINHDSPWNTRIHTGLPPTPISNVTGAALQAVAHPASTDYLYFVTGDDHITYFSQTLEEHQQNVTEHCQISC